MARIIKPISALDGPRRVSQYHTGPWIRNWTGLRPQKSEERWTHPDTPVPRPGRPAPPALLRVPVTITLVGSTRRTEREALHLIEDVNRIFLAAGVAFEVPELAALDADLDLQKLPNGEWTCPFEEDIDHRVPCLHLGLVEELGDLDALTLSCGRCLLLPDHHAADARTAAEGLAGLLGLMMVRSVQSERLMAEGGTGIELTGQECQTLRYHASHFLGQDPIHARNFAVPIWAYQVCSPESLKTSRSVSQLQALLHDANEIWEQADLHLQMHAWCHLQANEVGQDDWRALLENGLGPEGERLAAVSAHDPHAIHVFFLQGPAGGVKCKIAGERKRRLILVLDELGGRTVRAFSRVIGNLLGLPHVPQAEQLMCAQTEETLLTPHEIEVARGAALALVYG